MINTLTVDLETTIETYNKRKASPFSPKNWVVAAGYKHNDKDCFGNYFASPEGFRHHVIPFRTETSLLIGFNIKFDLLYMWEKAELREFFRRGGAIWDCQYVHYLLHGMRQKVQMASMDSVIEEYGGTLKLDEVKELWNEGINTPAIPETLLMDYLLGNPDLQIAGDIDNTHTIYMKQRALCAAVHPMFLTMVANRMDGLLSTTEMEYRGLQIDTVQGEEDRIDLKNSLTSIQDELNAQLPPLPDEFVFNWGSGQHRSILIFGGTLSYQKWEQHVFHGVPQFAMKTQKVPVLLEGLIDGEVVPYRYKSGKKKGEIKYKNVPIADETKPKGKLFDKYVTLPGLTLAREGWEGKLTDARGKPIYQTNSEVINWLGTNTDIPFLKELARSQKLSKDLSTYYWSEDKNGKRKGMLTLVDHSGRIHHKLNHCSTVTSRLSSSDPNLQNVPRGDKSLAKRMFVSRFGEAGRLVEIDYSQLEIIVQAVLSGDEQLRQDIRDGVDFHVKRLSTVTGKDYSDLKSLHISGDPDTCAQRTKIKAFSFQRAYGAGASAIADSTGMPIDEVKELIIAENITYPSIDEFDRKVQESIANSRTITIDKMFFDGRPHQIAIGEWFSPTGTRYVWSEHEAQDWQKERGRLTSFSPTERKNWPVQGLGGEIVQTMIGKLWRWFVAKQNFGGKAYLVNTVHDCVLIDVHQDVVDLVVPTAKKILEAVPFYFNKQFDMGIDVPFPVEAEIGRNWYEMKHYER